MQTLNVGSLFADRPLTEEEAEKVNNITGTKTACAGSDEIMFEEYYDNYIESVVDEILDYMKGRAVVTGSITSYADNDYVLYVDDRGMRLETRKALSEFTDEEIREEYLYRRRNKTHLPLNIGEIRLEKPLTEDEAEAVNRITGIRVAAAGKSEIVFDDFYESDFVEMVKKIRDVLEAYKVPILDGVLRHFMEEGDERRIYLDGGEITVELIRSVEDRFYQELVDAWKKVNKK